MITLGKIYRDSVSGFEGIAVSKTIHMHNNTADVGLEPTFLKDGKPMGVYWFKESRLEEKGISTKIGLGESISTKIGLGACYTLFDEYKNREKI